MAPSKAISFSIHRMVDSNGSTIDGYANVIIKLEPDKKSPNGTRNEWREIMMSVKKLLKLTGVMVLREAIEEDTNDIFYCPVCFAIF